MAFSTSIKLKIFWFAINYRQFYGFDYVTGIELHKDFKEIVYRPFESCPNLKHVYYAGTLEDWFNIKFYGCNIGSS